MCIIPGFGVSVCVCVCACARATKVKFDLQRANRMNLEHLTDAKPSYQSAQYGSQGLPSLIFSGCRKLFPEVNRPTLQLDHSPSSSVWIKDTCRNTSTPSHNNPSLNGPQLYTGTNKPLVNALSLIQRLKFSMLAFWTSETLNSQIGHYVASLQYKRKSDTDLRYIFLHFRNPVKITHHQSSTFTRTITNST